MEKARLGRWHTCHIVTSIHDGSRRNGKSPFRALTHSLWSDNHFDEICCVEMEKARLGRWHPNDFIFRDCILRRNGKSPFRALTQYLPKHEVFFSDFIVEMEKARLGRWHTILTGYSNQSCICRNGKRPFGALTHSRAFKYLSILIPVEMEIARLGRRHHLRNRPSFYLNLCKNERTDKFPSVFSINANEVYYY